MDMKEDAATETPEDRLRGAGEPTPMTVEQLADVCKNLQNGIIVYTGAGLSAGVVPTLKELNAFMKLSPQRSSEEEETGEEVFARSQRNFDYIVQLILNPEEIQKVLTESFFKKLVETEPTKAHQALAEIIKNYGLFLITENMDELHQKTGLNPLFLAGLTLYIGVKSLEEIIENADYILPIGLSADQSGFLKYADNKNPKIKIIAINTDKPNYLGEGDCLVQGDCQEILTKLWERLRDKLQLDQH